MEVLMSARPRPPFDPELEAVLAVLGEQLPSTLTPEMIPLMRQADVTPPIAEVLVDRDVVHEERTIPGFEGAEIVVSIFSPATRAGSRPGILHPHGGGMIIGDRFTGISVMLDWVERFGAVCVSVEYRLAPEHPDPYPVEDCYAALVWTAEHADELGIDADRLLIAGGSAGGGLAAGTTLLARDRRGPALLGQVLIYPMLDDRNETISSHQIDGEGVWDRTSNETGWDALLGAARGGDDVSIYAAPARAADLGGLPPPRVHRCRQRRGLPRRGRRLRLADLGGWRDRRAARLARRIPRLRPHGAARRRLAGHDRRAHRLGRPPAGGLTARPDLCPALLAWD
jgi:acetyl esterase/lipase